ncbi:MAG: pyridoxal phosphate-dependent aminotransferase [Patescibacteria group bacterium]
MLTGKGTLARRVQDIGVSGIRHMMSLAAKESGVISLGQGVPDARTPLYIREGVIELLRENEFIGKYSLSAGLPALKEVVARQLSEKAGFPVDADKNICITAGAIESLATAISSIVEVGDEVLLMDPGYPPYIEQVTFAGGIPVFVPLQSDNGWKIDLDKLRAAITPKTKLLIVCSPSNPTGMVLGKEEVEAIAKLAEEHDFFIFADQAYEYLVYDGKQPASFLAYPSIRDRLLVCYSFSKEFSMTGWRVGYLFAPENILEQVQKVHDAFVLCAPTISQYAALVALTKKPNDDPEGMRAGLAAKRELTCKRLDALSDLFSYSKPQGAFYILARYKKTGLNSREFAEKMLKEAKVVCIPGSAFGAQGEGHVRISYGASDERLNEAFDRIQKWNATL